MTEKNVDPESLQFLHARQPGEIWFCYWKEDPDKNWGLFEVESNFTVRRLANHNGPIYGDGGIEPYEQWVTNGTYAWTKIV